MRKKEKGKDRMRRNGKKGKEKNYEKILKIRGRYERKERKKGNLRIENGKKKRKEE